jgi:sugar lactone lactonase YvrE
MKFLNILFSLLLLGLFGCSEGSLFDPGTPEEGATNELGKWSGGGKVLATGSDTHGANGLFFGPDGNLYVASVFGREIILMDPLSGRILDRIGTGQGVEGPDDLTFGPDGSLYWTSITTGHVGRLAPDGTTTIQFVGLGVNPITFSDDGRLFVALAFFGDGLFELDPDLIAPPIPLTGPLGFLNGMDFGPDGRLYGPLIALGSIVSIDVDNPADIRWVASQSDGLAMPVAVKFDSNGELYAADLFAGVVWHVDVTTGALTLVSEVETGLDNLAFDARDRLYVSNNGSGAVHAILPSGIAREISDGGMVRPSGVAVMPGPGKHETVYVGDFWTLHEYDGLTGRLRSIQKSLLGATGMLGPSTVAPDGDNLVFTTTFHGTLGGVQVWNPHAGAVVELYEDFAVPLNAVRFMGDLVVAELVTGKLIRQDATTLVRTELAPLLVPTGIAITDDDLWAADWATGTVWHVVSDGIVLTPPLMVASGLAAPEGLAVDHDGTLLVVEAAAHRLTRIDPATGGTTVLAEGLALGAEAIPSAVSPPIGWFNGVAVGPSGAIYVTGDIGNVLYRF